VSPGLRIEFKLALLLATLVVVQTALGTFVPPPPSALRSALDQWEEAPRNVLYLGDSVLGYRPAEEQELPRLSQLVHDRVAPISLLVLDGNGLHAEVFASIVQALIHRDALPALIVIPINLRSLGPMWDRNPGLQLLELRLTMVLDRSWLRGWQRPALTWKALEPAQVSFEEYRRTPALRTPDEWTTIDRYWDRDFRDERVPEEWLAADYLGEIHEDHPKVRALSEIARMGRETPILFYFTPTDFETGRQLVGEVFDERVTTHIATITDVLEALDADVIDWSRLLGARHFARIDVVNEHLRESGREILAGEIAAAIRARVAMAE
jgi:hypothetical protein